jgi:hypothetical protein
MSVEARWALAGGAEGPLNPSTTPILELPEMERLYDPASHDMESDLVSVRTSAVIQLHYGVYHAVHVRATGVVLHCIGLCRPGAEGLQGSC